eukprot:Nk52_evm40s217 gene=Nk52_evmTU40s217
MLKKDIVLAIVFIILASIGTATADPSCSRVTDFVFIVDCSASMQPLLSSLTTGLTDFVAQQQNNTINVNLSFAIVHYGNDSLGPVVFQDFTTDGAVFLSNYANIPTNCGSWEPGLEAIRMSLNRASTNFANPLSYRDNSHKVIILLTNEDSDLPFNVGNRENNQTNETFCSSLLDANNTCLQSSFEPGFTPSIKQQVTGTDRTKLSTYISSELTLFQYFRSSASTFALNAAFELEVAKTAEAILVEGASVILAINQKGFLPVYSETYGSVWGPASSFDKESFYFANVLNSPSTSDSKTTSSLQYGDMSQQKSDADFKNFDRDVTLSQLQAQGLEKGFNYLVLSGQKANSSSVGTMRVFDIEKLGVDPNVAKNFFNLLSDQTACTRTSTDGGGGTDWTLIIIIVVCVVVAIILAILAYLAYKSHLKTKQAQAAEEQPEMTQFENNPMYESTTDVKTNDIYVEAS